MASWIKMYSDSSGYNGIVAAYARVVTSNPTLPRRALWNSTSGLVLANPGTVDTNAPTRMQYDTVLGLPLFLAAAAFRFDATDIATYPGQNLTGTMFIAPASAFAAGVTPTPEQIRLAATRIARGVGQGGSPSSRTTAGDLSYLDMRTAPHTPEPPNTKLWIMVTPTVVANMASTPSIANDLPVGGSANVLGRAVSVWTNRTPLAPVITAPAGRATTFAGAEIDFAFSPRDPDRVTSFPGDSGPNDFEDVAGVQIQYAPVATTENPTPEWIDLPIANTTGTAFGRGWYMDKSSTSPATDGAKQFWRTFKLKIRCGAVNPLAANAAYLPSGDWQLRVRTFDYGHAWSDSDNITVSPPGQPGEPPLADSSRSYRPENYPAVNTSPWSEPARVLVSAQVPKPIPLSPTNGIALIAGSPVTLSWQYRNTYSPPYPQGARVIQMRKVGDPDWTTVDVEITASSTWVVTGFALVSGNHYEWRVLVQDTSGVDSEYSNPASFWIVPVPTSGDVIVRPGASLDGATLGCGTHRVEVYRRGGKVKVGEITGITHLDYSRVRDDISTAKIVVKNWSLDCGAMLRDLATWAYEIVIFRDNGTDVDRVWEGPITLLTYENDAVTIHAKDLMVIAYRRIIRQAMSDAKDGATVVDRATRIMLNALAPDDPNVLAYLNPLPQIDDARQYRSVPAYSRTAFEEIDDMAANAGLDYTVLGRAILFWSTKHRIGTLPEFTDRDLGSSPIVSEYGMSFANGYVVSDGNGIYGGADRLDEDGKDETYGLVEMLSSTWASDSATETGTYTQEGIATVKASFAAAAERSISDRYPPPMHVRVPDNTRLNPDTPISIRHLVPGVVVPLRSTSTLRDVVATQKLDLVKVVEENGEEAITITLSPFSRDDATGEETEE